MDDLHIVYNYIKQEYKTGSTQDGSRLVQEYENLDLYQCQVEYRETKAVSKITSPRQYICQKCYGLSRNDYTPSAGGRALSPWSRALALLDEKRRWRRRWAELSKLYQEWLQKQVVQQCEEPDLLDYTEKIEQKSSQEATINISQSSTRYQNQGRKSTIEVREISVDSENKDCAESTQKASVVIVLDGEESTHNTSTQSTVQVDAKVEHLSQTSVELNDLPLFSQPLHLPSTPKGQKVANEPSTIASSYTSLSTSTTFSWTPWSPATPESLLRQHASVTNRSEPESPSLRARKASKKLNQTLEVPSPFTFDALPDDAFNYQVQSDGRSSSMPRHGVRHSRSRGSLNFTASTGISPRGKSPSLRDATQTASIKIEKDDHSGIFTDEQTDSKSHVSCAVDTSKTQPLFQWPEDTSYDQQTQQRKIHSIRKSKSFSNTARKSEIITKEVVKTESVRCINGIEILNLTTGKDMRALFNTEGHRCYANTLKGIRCRINLTTDNKIIGKILQQLEDINSLNGNFDRALPLVNELFKLTLCSSYHQIGIPKLLSNFCEWTKNLPSTIDIYWNSIIIKRSKPNDMKEDLHSGFCYWLSTRKPRQTVYQELRALVDKPLGLYDRKTGYIYVYRTQSVFGYLKIGVTKDTVDKRLKKWEYQCRHKPDPVLSSCARLPYARRVEQLVHTELQEHRLEQLGCVCGTRHEEWFKVPEAKVQATIEKWSAWIKTEPYDEEAWNLKEDYRSTSHEICLPLELRSPPTVDSAATLEQSVRSSSSFNFTPIPPELARTRLGRVPLHG